MKLLLAVLLSTVSASSIAQTTYSIDANIKPPPVYSGHLKMGGNNGRGDSISVSNFYISINGKPVIPVTGEFHFSRYPSKYWEESIRKMKAGGITVIATYVFWNLHEEVEGRFNWSGDKNLRAFVELCKKQHMHLIVRIGPFCHGEIRNGGLPDWLLGRPLTIRSNDPQYLAYVERLYKQTASQLRGLLYKNGGPVIGIQIENEYQHSAAPWGLTYPGQPNDMTAAERDQKLTQEGVGVSAEKNPYADLGKDHMKVLKGLAQKAGMDVPFFTATGWGNAAIVPNETIPVTAAYAYPFWTPKRDYSPFFLYKDMHRNPDYSPVRYKPEDYPVFAAELGSGIMTVYTRRPVAVHRSMDAMINRCIGSGANGIGYYMYHGGSTPRGQYSFMSDEAYGLPKISYDFQAPIGEYGQLREGFHRLKLLHFFLQDFGELLAPMATVLPQNASGLKPDNITDLRYAVRIADNGGFVFLNNFQDDTAMLDQKNIQLKINTASGELAIPEKGGFDLPSGENAVFPFNFDLNGNLMKYSTAQLLSKIEDGGKTYFIFFSPEGVKSEFCFGPTVKLDESSNVEVDRNTVRTIARVTDSIAQFELVADGKRTQVLVVNKALALRSYIVLLKGKKHLVFSDATILQTKDGFEMLGDNKVPINCMIYPASPVTPTVTSGKITRMEIDRHFSSWTISLPRVALPLDFRKISERKWAVKLPQQLPAGLNDLYLTTVYTGDTGMGFLDGQLVADEFYKGLPWQIGLRQFLGKGFKEMVFYFRPMQKNASYLVDLQPYPGSIPDFGESKTYLKVKGFAFEPQYKTSLQF